MSARKHWAVELAVGLAVMMHLLLFLVMRPTGANALSGVAVPPETRYLAKTSDPLPAAGGNVRTLWSPVLFSLPSEMGFSRDLLNENLRTRLTFSQLVESERFLEVDPASHETGPQVLPQELMITAGAVSAPRLPQEPFQSLEKRPAARRVYVAPELKERLVGGVVLPPELNQDAAASSEVRADVSISKEGAPKEGAPTDSCYSPRIIISL